MSEITYDAMMLKAGTLKPLTSMNTFTGKEMYGVGAVATLMRLRSPGRTLMLTIAEFPEGMYPPVKFTAVPPIMRETDVNGIRFT